MNPCAYQCHDPEADNGFIMVFRRPGSTVSEIILHAEVIKPEVDYDIEVFRGGTSRIRGTELSNLKITLPEPRSAKLIMYSRSKSNAKTGT